MTLRTNWLFYGSHSIFLLGIDKGFYEKEGIDLTVKQGNGSGNAVRLVANGDSDFAYGSAVTMLNLAAQGAPVIAVATIDAQGTDAVLVNPDSGIKTFKDLEGQKVLTTAGAGVNTLFPVAAANDGADVEKISLTNVAESALVSSYLQGLAPAMLGGMDDKPAEIKANGGKQPVILNYGDCRSPATPSSPARRWWQKNPDLVRRFVKATLQAVDGRPGQPGRVDPVADQLVRQRRGPEGAGARGAGRHPVHPEVAQQQGRRLGYNVPADWDSALEILKKYKELKTDQPASAFYTNEFIPPAELSRA